MKRCLVFLGLAVPLVFAMSGCVEDHRSREEKQFAPSPEYASRYTMQCYKCKAPQKPYRIDAIKSYYKCSGHPPKFPYHEEVQWTHRISDHDPQIER
jgi:hypothetical protein